MFEELLKLFGKENLLEQSFTTTIKMLEFDEQMFEASVQTLRHADSADLPFNIYEKDKKINKYEREVRRNVLTHLTVSGSKNVGAGLILISIVIDVERIGDYTKNIAELAVAHPQKLHGGQLEEELVEIETSVEARFRHITRGLLDHDEDVARSIMSEHKNIAGRCEKALNDIWSEKDKNLTPGNAVILALYFRYLKRIAAHLTNIASSIINPFPRIGFREKEK